MTRRSLCFRLGIPALAAGLLLPVASVRADDTLPLFRFAPQWLKKHAPQHASGPDSLTPSREAAADLHKQLSGERQKAEALRERVAVRNAREKRGGTIAPERDSLKPAPAVRKALPVKTVPARAAPPANTHPALPESGGAPSGRAHESSSAVRSAGGAPSAQAGSLALAQTEISRLQLASRALTARDDILSARLASLQDVSRDNLRLKTALSGAVAAQETAQREAATLRAQLAASAEAREKLPAVATASEEPAGAALSPSGTHADRHNVQMGDYAAGVAFGRQALAAVRMNALLGIAVTPRDLAEGFTDTLLNTIRYPGTTLDAALKSRSQEVMSARDRVIAEQKEKGRLALAAFRRRPGVQQDGTGYWYLTEKTGDLPPSPGSILHVTVRESLADGTVIQKDSAVRQPLAAFPPLFRSVTGRLKLHGTATFLVPPALAYGDDGFPPRIPPGATMLYTLSVTGEEKSRESAADSAARAAGARYLAAFIREPGVRKSASGFWYQIREQGDGGNIHGSDTVTTVMRESLTDGRVLSDMVAEKKAVSMPLDRYPPVFREALSLLHDHGAIRLVVPPELAYGDTHMPAVIPPGSTVVYDIRVVGVNGATPAPSADAKGKA